MDRYTEKRKQRTIVFEDTMAWIRTDRKLAEAVADSQAGTILYRADEMPELSAPKNKTMKVTVTMERSFEAAMRRKSPYAVALRCIHVWIRSSCGANTMVSTAAGMMQASSSKLTFVTVVNSPFYDCAPGAVCEGGISFRRTRETNQSSGQLIL